MGRGSSALWGSGAAPGYFGRKREFHVLLAPTALRHVGAVTLSCFSTSCLGAGELLTAVCSGISVSQSKRGGPASPPHVLDSIEVCSGTLPAWILTELVPSRITPGKIPLQWIDICWGQEWDLWLCSRSAAGDSPGTNVLQRNIRQDGEENSSIHYGK